MASDDTIVKRMWLADEPIGRIARAINGTPAIVKSIAGRLNLPSREAPVAAAPAPPPEPAPAPAPRPAPKPRPPPKKREPALAAAKPAPSPPPAAPPSPPVAAAPAQPKPKPEPISQPARRPPAEIRLAARGVAGEPIQETIYGRKIVSSNPRPVLDRNMLRECAWPVGPVPADMSQVLMCCNQVATEGKPYCPDHAFISTYTARKAAA